MARSRKIKRNRKKKQSSFLPESLQAFIARRLVDGIAFAFLALGGFISVALFTYDRSDPSWNSSGAEDNAVQNAAGLQGAYLADILAQTLGYASLVLGLGALVWAVRIFKRRTLRPISLRFAAMLFSALAASIMFAYMLRGGSAGRLIFDQTESFVSVTGLPYISEFVGFSFGLIAFGLFLYGSAVTQYEIASVWFRIKMAAYIVATAIVGVVHGFMNWVARYNQPDYESESSLKLNLMEKLRQMREQRAEARAEQQRVEVKSGSVDMVEAAVQPVAEPIVTKEQASEPSTRSVDPSIPVVKPPEGSRTVKLKNTGQKRFALSDVDGEWEFPPVSLIQDVPEGQKCETLNEDALRRNAELLQSVLADFNVKGEIVSIHPGPVVTLYEFEPAPGTKSSRVISLSDDIARSMSAISVRCAVVPGRNVIGIELPNKHRQTVYMKEMILSRLYDKTSARLPLILGKDIGGQPVLADLAKMPHLLVAGTTGSGKSVAVNTMIMSLLYRLSPEQCRFIMIDPKMLELSVYDDIPHLLSPVVTDPGKAIVALKWAVHEMEERYRNMSKLGVRNIEGYNQRMREALKNGEQILNKVQTGFDPETGKPTFEDREMELAELPYIVIIVDEFADLMLVAGKDVENAIQRLAQMARAAGLHLIMATQRPSVDVITGVVKANFPTRISFQVTSKIDSRTILGDSGAEQLLGMGDMLYMAPGGRITRVHGPFASDDDVEKTSDFLRAQAQPAYISDVTSEDADFGADSAVMNAMFGGGGSSDGDKVDELYDQAVAIITKEGKVSTSFVQRHLQIGYNRAARIIEEMERQGVISQASATGKRQILVQDHSGV